MKRTPTPKQKLFVQQYLIDKNASQAAIRAGFKQEDYGRELLTKTHVREAIDNELASEAERLGITRQRVLDEMARCAFVDPRKIFNEDGSLKAITDLDPDTAAAIAGVEIEALFAGKGEDKEQIGKTNRVKFVNKTTALDQLGKHLGLFEKDNKQVGEGAVDALAQILANAAGAPVDYQTLIKKSYLTD